MSHATLCGQSGNYREAAEAYRALLPDLTRVLGHDHPLVQFLGASVSVVAALAEQSPSPPTDEA